jgi:uncharacterized membrane protein
MIYLLLGLIVFLGVHSISIVAPNWRDAMLARMGEGAWKGLYSVISIVGFVLLVWGYGQARMEAVVLYNPPGWTRWIAAVLLLPVFPLLLAPYFPGRIKAALKHPMLVAVKIWALAHLIANGSSADVLLFGAFLAWAVLDRISLKRRPQRPIPALPPRAFNDVITVVLGLVLYFLFMHWLHARWIGVSPMPLMSS